ncbi:MAG: hypothetical protein DI585_02455 [Pseudomonas fluorescens]|nr:MAG: hypothetical protein DI585_02455 [Pseudomonas fluorescens]
MNIKRLLIGSAAAFAAMCITSAASAKTTPPSTPAKDIVYYSSLEVANACTLAAPNLVASNETGIITSDEIGVAPALTLNAPGPKMDKLVSSFPFGRGEVITYPGGGLGLREGDGGYKVREGAGRI